MALPLLRLFLAIALLLLPLAVIARADEQTEKAVQATLAKFDKGDPGWKVRMEALVGLAKSGPDAVPVLGKALKSGSPTTREFAAQALVLFADPSSRSALEQALADTKPQVRLYAIQALSMLGALTPNEQTKRILSSDPAFWSVRPMMAVALERNDGPNPAELRKALADYDLHSMDSAHIGEIAPDFTLKDFTGKMHRLSQFRGKKTVVLRFILYDYWWRTVDTFTQLREGEKEYKRRNVQPIVVLAQHAFQLKRPKTVEKDWAWPGDIPAEVLFDPLATVSATYGVAFQTQFRGKEGPWSSQPTIFVIDREGVIRYVNGRLQQDIREKEIFPILDKLSATKAGIK